MFCRNRRALVEAANDWNAPQRFQNGLPAMKIAGIGHAIQQQRIGRRPRGQIAIGDRTDIDDGNSRQIEPIGKCIQTTSRDTARRAKQLLIELPLDNC